MKTALVTVTWVAALLGAADAWGQTGPVEVRGRRWRPSLSGDLRADDNGAPGTSIDTRAMLDLTDEPDLNDICAVLNIPGMGRMNLQQWEGSFERDGVTLGQDLVFGGTTFSAGSVINSALDWRVATMMMEYDPSTVPFYGMPAAVSVDAGVKYIRFHGQLDGASFAQDCSVKGYLPAVGFHAKVQPLSYVTIEADVNGQLVKTFELSGVNGTAADIAVAAQLAYQNFTGGIGYRWFKMKIEDDRTDVDTVQAKLVLKGVFVELGVKF